MDWRDLRPEDIEKRSFAMIKEQLGEIDMPPAELNVLLRVIHTSADFDYARNLWFSPGALEVGLAALKAGASILTDTQMALAGINKTTLAKLGGAAHCFMADAEVATEAKERGTTRAAVSMEKAVTLPAPLIVAVGNAPTALLRLSELIGEGRLSPALIIAAPVGFVNVEESKETIMEGETPCVVARGLKGGSPVAAAIVNALMYMI